MSTGELQTRRLTAEMARQVAGWRYPTPFDCYDYPDWDDLVRDRWAITDDLRREGEFRAAIRPGMPELAGYYWLRPGSDGAVEFSCGLAPDLCGRGLGESLVRLAITEWKNSGTDAPLRLLVRPFNRRAITVYERCGFHDIGREHRVVVGSETEFMVMDLSRA